MRAGLYYHVISVALLVRGISSLPYPQISRASQPPLPAGGGVPPPQIGGDRRGSYGGAGGYGAAAVGVENKGRYSVASPSGQAPANGGYVQSPSGATSVGGQRGQGGGQGQVQGGQEGQRKGGGQGEPRGRGGQETGSDGSYRTETKYYYGGKYQDNCATDGLYYRDDTAFVICSNGYPHEQPCPPGTKTSGSPKYQAGYYYGYTDLCSVNLVDYGYGPEYYAPKGYPLSDEYNDRKKGEYSTDHRDSEALKGYPKTDRHNERKIGGYATETRDYNPVGVVGLPQRVVGAEQANRYQDRPQAAGVYAIDQYVSNKISNKGNR